MQNPLQTSNGAKAAQGANHEIALHVSRSWQIAWLGHLLIPALLVADILAALIRQKIVFKLASPGTAVLFFSILWLVGGIAMFVAVLRKPARARATYTALLLVYTAYVAVIAMEGIVRIAGFSVPVWGAQPGIRAVTTYSAETGPGMAGVKHFTTNKLGLRGPMPPADRRTYRIVTIGGSTTICSELDDSEEWPHVLMEDLNALKTTPAWVGNAGSSGKNSVHHIVTMQWLPGQLDFDMVVFLLGANDLQATLARNGGPTESELEKQAGFQGKLPAGARWRTGAAVYPYYRRLRIFPAIEAGRRNLSALLQPQRSLPFSELGALRKRRAAGPVIPLPDLSIGLKEYSKRVIALSDLCHVSGKRCLFLTQPTLWRADLSPYEKSLLWAGYAGPWENPVGYVSAGDMERAQDLYNRTLLAVCTEQKLECLDLASLIPKDVTMFHDEMHFNPSGARFVAGLLSHYLAASTPFLGNSGSGARP